MKSSASSNNPQAGFGKRCETKERYIANYIRQRNLNPFIIQRQQQDWFRDYSSREYEYSLDDLLQCPHHDLSIFEYPNDVVLNDSHSHLKPVLYGVNGFWTLCIVRDTNAHHYDFTISVSSGDMQKFHPVVIKNDICKKYGTTIYETWKSMILDDLACLTRLVEFVQKRISYVIPSITCCPSSARLCQRVGIPVRNEIAFLFPSSYM